jgi:hypothetical protein
MVQKELRMPADGRMNIAVISTAKSIPIDIETAWAKANVCLEGPYCASAVQDQLLLGFAAAVIDVRYSADVILSLSRKFDLQAIPHLFFVVKELVGVGQGPFILSDRPNDIESIVAALRDQGVELKH